MPNDPSPARPERGRIRLFVEEELGAGRAIGLAAAQAHYLKNVMRLDRGDAVYLFNGRDGEWRARVDGVGRGWCSLAVGERLRAQRQEPDLWLVFAPVKRARLDFLAQHATELGVSALVPVFTRHTAVTRLNAERLLANAVEAAEQSERLSVPEVFEPATLERVLAAWPVDRRLFLCDESGAAAPAGAAFAAAAEEAGESGPGPAAVMVGPEGGFAASELDGLRKLPFVIPVGLGPRVLRTETAAMAALACWQAYAGDWRG